MPSIASRLGAYQRERFPLAAYAPLVAVSAFAALAFSRALRGASPLPGALQILVAGLTMLALFFLLRVLDEHKDADHDARWRPELPVPRGLVSLRELRVAGAAAVGVVALANLAVHPALLLPLALAVAYAGLMAKEFFVPEWLRARPLAYLLSHMVIMPLVFLHASAVDWLTAGAAGGAAGAARAASAAGLALPSPPEGLWILLAFAFADGLVIEIGRKLRSPAEEREGVDTYTAAWGLRRAVGTWLAAVGAGAALLVVAAVRLGGGLLAVVVAGLMAGLAPVVALFAARLVRGAPGVSGKTMETASGLWVLVSYLLLATLPFLQHMGGPRG